MKKLALALALLLSSAMPSLAVNCPGYPFTFTNNTTADASQVNANFNLILNCANTSLAPLQNPNFTGIINGNSEILTGGITLGTPLSITGGGTGQTTAGAAFNALGASGGTIGGPLGIIAAPVTDKLEVTGAIRAAGSSVNFNLGPASAVMDFTGGVARIGGINGTGANTETDLLVGGGAAMKLMTGVQIASPTGGDKGAGTINAAAADAYFSNGKTIGQGAKVWASYNGSTSTRLADYNIASVTKNGTGDYTFNFTTSFASGTFSCVASSTVVTFQTSKAAGSVRITTFTLTGGSTFAAGDSTDVNVACYGAQ